MFFFKPLDTCSKFISQVNESLQSIGARQLSTKQQRLLSLCITGVLVTNSGSWKWVERSCFGKYKANTISKMFCRTKVFWDTLLFASVHRVIKAYGITHGVLALDGTDNKRSKNTKKISKVHKLKDKASGGSGQDHECLIIDLQVKKAFNITVQYDQIASFFKIQSCYMNSLISHFSVIKDPRQLCKVEHELIDILILCVVGILCGADGWSAIEMVGHARLDWFQDRGLLKNGVPVDDTIARIISSICPSELQTCFINWMQSIASDSEGKVIAIDGKTLRHSFDKKTKQKNQGCIEKLSSKLHSA